MNDDGRVVRYAPTLELPSYAFLPGRAPHPTRDPRGHSFKIETPAVIDPAPDRWRDNAAWLFGVDLYNHGFAWEAHEAWEILWRTTRDPDQKRFVQGLIQCAAAALKQNLGNAVGCARLACLGTDKLDDLRTRIPGRYMGLNHAAFAADFRAFGTSAAARFEARPRLVLE